MYNGNRTRESPILPVIIPQKWLTCNFSLISMHTLFSKRVEERVKKFEKFMTVLILKNCKRNHLISCSLNEWTWKNITESQDRWNFERLHTLFVIYTCDTTLHFCYKRMHSFSANQKLVIFSCTLSNTVIIWCIKCFRWLHEVAPRYTLPKRV